MLKNKDDADKYDKMNYEMMPAKDNFIKHACEQVLRFTQIEKWNYLPEELKVQLSFNMGALALGLSLSKDKGFLALSDACKEKISMQEFHKHIRGINVSYNIECRFICNLLF